MKILIAYASKSGTTEKCAKLLAEQLNAERIELVDLSTQKKDPAPYDFIVIGGSIRMGQLHKSVKQYIIDYENVLLKKRTAYFICCGFLEKKDVMLTANIPMMLRESAVAVECFGGEMDINRLRGIDRFIAKMVTKATADKNISPPCIQYDRIAIMAEKMKSMMAE